MHTAISSECPPFVGRSWERKLRHLGYHEPPKNRGHRWRPGKDICSNCEELTERACPAHRGRESVSCNKGVCSKLSASVEAWKASPSCSGFRSPSGATFEKTIGACSNVDLLLQRDGACDPLLQQHASVWNDAAKSALWHGRELK